MAPFRAESQSRVDFDGETYYAGKPSLFEELGYEFARPRSATDDGMASERTRGDGLSDGTLADLEGEGKAGVLVFLKIVAERVSDSITFVLENIGINTPPMNW